MFTLLVNTALSKSEILSFWEAAKNLSLMSMRLSLTSLKLRPFSRLFISVIPLISIVIEVNDDTTLDNKALL